MKGHYRRRLENQLEKYIKDDSLRRHMLPTTSWAAGDSFRPTTISRIGPRECRRGHQRDRLHHARGIRTKDGKEVALDVIVYATGYFAYSNMKKALTFQVYGLGGRNLNSEWEAEAVSYKGITVSGYPNYFKVNGPNTGTGHSSQMSYMEVATDYIVQAICAVISTSASGHRCQARTSGCLRRRHEKKMRRTVWQNATCTAFYRKNMTDEVTSLSPEPVTGFILSRKWFR